MFFKEEGERAQYWLDQARLIRGHRAKAMYEMKPFTSEQERLYWRQELTPRSIFMEENISVRVAKIYCYGVEKFLQDGAVQTLDSEAGYELIALKMMDYGDIVAIKMICPSTKTIYLIPVPPHLTKVSEALDWYFSIPNFLERVGAQA
jgi:hypothetical protein